MMRIFLPLLLVLNWVSAESHAEVSYGDEPSKASTQRFMGSFRGGFLLSPADPEAGSKWTHTTFSSYGVSLGAHYVFPLAIPDIQLLAGGNFDYLSSEEAQSSSFSDSYLTTSMMQLLASAGLIYSPKFLGGDWGLGIHVSYEIWGQKESTLETTNMTRGLGNENTGAALIYAIEASYKLSSVITGTLTYQSRHSNHGDIIWVGGRYGF